MPHSDGTFCVQSGQGEPGDTRSFATPRPRRSLRNLIGVLRRPSAVRHSVVWLVAALVLAAWCTGCTHTNRTTGTVIAHAVVRAPVNVGAPGPIVLRRFPVSARVALVDGARHDKATTSAATGRATITIPPGTYRVFATMAQTTGVCWSRPRHVHVLARATVTVDVTCRSYVGGG